MAEDCSVSGKRIRKEKLKKLIEQAEELTEYCLPEQMDEATKLAKELIQISSKIKKRENSLGSVKDNR